MTRVILCFGDSNTHGTQPMATLDGNGRFGHDARWPSVMGRALGPAYEVIAEGHPGRTTVHDDPTEGPHRNGVRVLPALLESHKPLDLVILKLGTNDLKYGFHVGPFDIAQAIDRLVRLVQGFGAGPAPYQCAMASAKKRWPRAPIWNASSLSSSTIVGHSAEKWSFTSDDTNRFFVRLAMPSS